MKPKKKSFASFLIALILLLNQTIIFANSSPGTINLQMSEEMSDGNTPKLAGQQSIYVAVEKFLPGTYPVIVQSPGRNGTQLGSGEISVPESGNTVFNLYQVTKFGPTDNKAGLYSVMIGNKTKNFTLEYVEIKPDYWMVNFAAGSNGSLSGKVIFTEILDGTNWEHAVTVPTPEPDPGYQFDGWNPDFPATIDQDWTFTAQFSLIPIEPDYWDVSFLAGPNGSLTGAVSFQDILDGTAWGDAVSVPTAVPDSGYQFDGWDLEFPETVEQDWTFTAQFSLIPVDPGDPTPQDLRADGLVAEGFIPIANAAELDKMRNSYPVGELFAQGTKWENNYVTTGLSDKYVLVRAIRMNSGEDWLPVGTSLEPFTGTFDGNDYEIIDLVSRNGEDISNVGLFGYVAGGLIRYLDLAGPVVTGQENVGAVAGYILNAHLMNIRVQDPREGLKTAEIQGISNVGGLVGYSKNSRIEHIVNEASINGNQYIAGIAGGQDVNSTIFDAVNNGPVSALGSVGGIVGANYGVIKRALNLGAVTGDGFVGGIAGGSFNGWLNERNSVEQAVNTGSIKGGTGLWIGGIAGYVANDQIADVYNIGTIEGTLSVGGIIGHMTLGFLDNVYNSSKIISSAKSEIVGLIELSATITDAYYNSDMKNTSQHNDGIALTNEEMTDPAKFTGFDFEGVWNIVDGSYPFLRWHSSIYIPLKAELPQ